MGGPVISPLEGRMDERWVPVQVRGTCRARKRNPAEQIVLLRQCAAANVVRHPEREGGDMCIKYVLK